VSIIWGFGVGFALQLKKRQVAVFAVGDFGGDWESESGGGEMNYLSTPP